MKKKSTTYRPEQNKSSVNNTSIYTYKWLHISEYKKPLSLMLFLYDIRQYKNLERECFRKVHSAN